MLCAASSEARDAPSSRAHGPADAHAPRRPACTPQRDNRSKRAGRSRGSATAPSLVSGRQPSPPPRPPKNAGVGKVTHCCQHAVLGLSKRWTGSGQGSDNGMAAGRRRDTLAEHLLDRAAAYGGDVDDGCVFPWQRLLAVCFIALAVGTWVTEIQVTNSVLGGDDAYDNAYALVWLAHVASGLFALVFAAGMGCCLPAPGDGDLTLKELLLRPSRDTLVNSLFMAILPTSALGRGSCRSHSRRLWSTRSSTNRVACGALSSRLCCSTRG